MIASWSRWMKRPTPRYGSAEMPSIAWLRKKRPKRSKAICKVVQMPTKYTGRVLLILFVLWVAGSFIFPAVPGSMLWFADPKQTITTHPNLKPGIDMVGGTSLVYEIK